MIVTHGRFKTLLEDVYVLELVLTKITQVFDILIKDELQRQIHINS